MALKPCKECGTDVSTKAFRCPSCGVSNPTLDGKKTAQNALAVLIGLLALLILPFIGGGEAPSSTPAATSPVASTEAQAALHEIKGLDWVKDAIYQDYAAIQWQVGILNNGRNPVWAAQSICDLLSLRGLVNKDTNVRVVDIVKVTQGQDFRKASLGRVNCETREQNYP